MLGGGGIDSPTNYIAENEFVGAPGRFIEGDIAPDGTAFPRVCRVRGECTDRAARRETFLIGWHSRPYCCGRETHGCSGRAGKILWFEQCPDHHGSVQRL